MSDIPDIATYKVKRKFGPRVKIGPICRKQPFTIKYIPDKESLSTQVVKWNKNY